jgi:tetratricopeptide (TPR) repeat protein
MSSVFSLFDILAIIYLFRSVQLGLKIWREWAQIRIEPFTSPKKHLADQASYFIAVPIGVLAHEIGHVLAVWLSGGEVAEFHYRAFWGYVVPIGSFTAAQDWFIAIAGTMASLAFGLFIWLLFRRAPSTTLRYFGLRAFRFQVYFSLIYYPLFTLLGFIGDWRTIYNFAATPVLSLVTALLHTGILFLFWRGDRTGWFEAPSHENTAEQERFEELAATAAVSPHDAQIQIRYIDGLRRGGAKRKAEHQLKRFLAENPDSAAGYLELAALLTAGKRQIPKKASESAEKALTLGLAEPGQVAYANELIGRYKLESGQVEGAINNFSEALANLPDDDPMRIHIHVLRSQALRRQRRYDESYRDIQQIISYAQKTGDKASMAMARQELETLENHAGPSFGAAHLEIQQFEEQDTLRLS